MTQQTLRLFIRESLLREEDPPDKIKGTLSDTLSDISIADQKPESPYVDIEITDVVIADVNKALQRLNNIGTVLVTEEAKEILNGLKYLLGRDRNLSYPIRTCLYLLSISRGIYEINEFLSDLFDSIARAIPIIFSGSTSSVDDSIPLDEGLVKEWGTSIIKALKYAWGGVKSAGTKTGKVIAASKDTDSITTRLTTLLDNPADVAGQLAALSSTNKVLLTGLQRQLHITDDFMAFHFMISVANHIVARSGSVKLTDDLIKAAIKLMYSNKEFINAVEDANWTEIIEFSYKILDHIYKVNRVFSAKQLALNFTKLLVAGFAGIAILGNLISWLIDDSDKNPGSLDEIKEIITTERLIYLVPSALEKLSISFADEPELLDVFKDIKELLAINIVSLVTPASIDIALENVNGALRVYRD